MKFRKKPVVIEADLWFKNGDHPFDDCEITTDDDGQFIKYEGKVVRYYRNPSTPGLQECKHCGKIMHVHGWIDTLEGGHIVCPGDYIITGPLGERYPCKPSAFQLTYEKVEEDNSLDDYNAVKVMSGKVFRDV